MLHDINVYVQSFKMTGEVRMLSIRMIFDVKPGLDRRRYNIPIANEQSCTSEKVMMYQQRVSVYHRCSSSQKQNGTRCGRRLPMRPTYVSTFFPRGGPGWDPSIRKRRSSRLRTRISQIEYYLLLILFRSSFNPLHHGGGKLFQQYLVDSYVKIEQNRLNYARTRRELRLDHVVGSEDVQTAAGQRIILTPIQEGPRAMHQSYQDAMAIAVMYGSPDYFITFTRDPKWREIVKSESPQRSKFQRSAGFSGEDLLYGARCAHFGT
ncbi:unnamed protein product [Nippostrongylus brasiliensis]|uniref:Helitron_like_N domain-containing protein n=1 Tax=Nippostrongylus brasiliensis TaxID=27835 RepID=A0A0N4XZ70_NIPBR|nr:unnamed protein product [Nippostrongylus brasiliensis]